METENIFAFLFELRGVLKQADSIELATRVPLHRKENIHSWRFFAHLEVHLLMCLDQFRWAVTLTDEFFFHVELIVFTLVQDQLSVQLMHKLHGVRFPAEHTYTKEKKKKKSRPRRFT